MVYVRVVFIEISLHVWNADDETKMPNYYILDPIVVFEYIHARLSGICG